MTAKKPAAKPAAPATVYVVTAGNIVVDNTGKKFAGEATDLTEAQAKPLLGAGRVAAQ